MKYEIDYVQHTYVTIEAESMEEAEDIASMMDGEEIAEYENNEYNIFQIKQM